MATLNRSFGMVLLAIWLILTGLSGLIGLHFTYEPQVLGVLALVAGLLILLGR